MIAEILTYSFTTETQTVIWIYLAVIASPVFDFLLPALYILKNTNLSREIYVTVDFFTIEHRLYINLVFHTKYLNLSMIVRGSYKDNSFLW